MKQNTKQNEKQNKQKQRTKEKLFRTFFWWKKDPKRERFKIDGL